MLLTTARTSSPSTSSITAAARMILLEVVCSSPLADSTCAVMPTLVATIDAPTKMASLVAEPQSRRIPVPRMNGTTTPERATTAAVPPTFSSSDDFTSRPTRNSRNIAPRSERALRNSLGASHPSTLGPIRTPARISPTMPGWPIRSASSARTLAETNTISMASGMLAGPLVPKTSAALGRAERSLRAGYTVRERRRTNIAAPPIPAATASGGAPLVTRKYAASTALPMK